MGKKGKKKKSGKTSKEPEVTWNEALLAYKISIQEKHLEDVKYELRALEDKHNRNHERNERLKSEQLLHVENLLKQAKTFNHDLESQPVITKDEVVMVMKEKWDAQRTEEKNITKLKEDLAKLQAAIVIEQQQVDYWREYSEQGHLDHRKQIDLLEAELQDMQLSYEEMVSHIENTWSKTKNEILVDTNTLLDDQKYLASQRAMSGLDKYSKREVLDNDWLKRETSIHTAEIDKIMVDVEQLEKENLEILAELFECTVDDLKISRNFFLTQFTDDENLEETGILELDLGKLSIDSQQKDETRKERPMSAMEKKIMTKIQLLPADSTDLVGDEEEEEADGEAKEKKLKYHMSEFENYYNFDGEHYEDYLKLGPLELKLLNLTGRQMTIQKPKPLPAEEMEALNFRPQMWPLKQSMLNFSRPDRKEKLKCDGDDQQGPAIVVETEQQ